jgi:hypothetical protein
MLSKGDGIAEDLRQSESKSIGRGGLRQTTTDVTPISHGWMLAEDESGAADCDKLLQM